jgi:hypothetical protein
VTYGRLFRRRKTAGFWDIRHFWEIRQAFSGGGIRQAFGNTAGFLGIRHFWEIRQAFSGGGIRQAFGNTAGFLGIRQSSTPLPFRHRLTLHTASYTLSLPYLTPVLHRLRCRCCCHSQAKSLLVSIVISLHTKEILMQISERVGCWMTWYMGLVGSLRRGGVEKLP